MDNQYAVLIKGFKSEEQANDFIKWFEGQGEQDADMWFEECGFRVRTNLEATYPISHDTILDGSHREVEVSELHIDVKEF